jgi:Uma2 family endonuclease
MVATAPTALMTVEEFTQWMDQPEQAGRRCELVNGVIVDMPNPTRFHGTVCGNIAFALGTYIRSIGSGSVSTNDSGLVVSRNPDTVRGPDVMLFLEEEELDDIPRSPSTLIPPLVVEVLSPSDRPARTVRRVRSYLDCGVKVVWIVDPEDRMVTIYVPNELPLALDVTEEIPQAVALPGLRVRVSDLFLLPKKS